MVQFAAYLRSVLCKTRLIFPRINGPNVEFKFLSSPEFCYSIADNSYFSCSKYSCFSFSLATSCAISLRDISSILSCSAIRLFHWSRSRCRAFWCWEIRTLLSAVVAFNASLALWWSNRTFSWTPWNTWISKEHNSEKLGGISFIK